MKELTLQLNERCNLSCEYCFANTNGTSEINNDDLTYFIDFCKKNNIDSIHVTGGEPMLFSQFKFCIEEFSSFAYTVVYSNFTVHNAIQSLELQNPDLIFLVNINHPEDYTPTQWKNLWDNVIVAKHKGIRLAFGHTFHRDDFQRDFEYMVNLNKKYDVKLLRLSQAISNHSSTFKSMDRSQIQVLYRYISQQSENLRSMGIKCYFDCPLPPCWIEPDVYAVLRKNLMLPAKCDPKVFVAFDLSIHHCYIEPQKKHTLTLRDFSTFDDVRDFSEKRTLTIMRQKSPKCKICSHSDFLLGCGCPFESSYRF